MDVALYVQKKTKKKTCGMWRPIHPRCVHVLVRLFQKYVGSRKFQLSEHLRAFASNYTCFDNFVATILRRCLFRLKLQIVRLLFTKVAIFKEIWYFSREVDIYRRTK